MIEYAVVKRYIPTIVALILHATASANTEVWYNWQGQRVGELPAEIAGKTQPQDLIANGQALIRMPLEPWNMNRRYRRIGDWYRDRDYSISPDYVGWGGWSFPYRYNPIPRPRLNIWYGSSGNWGINYQSPGFLLHWHH